MQDNEEGWAQSRSGKSETMPSTSKDRIVCQSRMLLRTLDIPCVEALEWTRSSLIAASGMTHRCPMRKRVSLQRSITLSVLSIGLLSGAFGLAYAYWQTKHSFREAIGLGFQELARQSADKVGLILEKEIEWVERLSSLPQVREAVREGTRLTFDQPGP